MPPGSIWLGPVDPNHPVICTIRVRPGSFAPTDSPDPAQGRGEGEPGFNEPVDPGGDAADPRDLDRIQEFVGEVGLEVIDVDALRRTVLLGGSAGAIADAFSVQLARYKYGGKVRLGHVAPIYLPAAIADIVEEVSDLENDEVPRPAAPAFLRFAVPQFPGRLMVGPLLALVAGGALGAFLFGGHSGSASRPPAAVRLAQEPGRAPAPPMSSTVQQLESGGWKLLQSGRLADAQEDFLRALAIDPGRVRAMQGLVAVRRKVAADDPRVIRKQMAAYQDAMTRGTATGEYYTPSALRLLVSASMRALRELGASAEPAAPVIPPTTVQAPVAQPARPLPPPPPAKRPAAPPAAPPARPPAPAANVASKGQDHSTVPAAAEGPKPPVAAAPQTVPQPAGSASPGTPTSQPTTLGGPSSPQRPPAVSVPAPAAPTPPAPDRQYMVRIGPMLDRDHATAVVRQLSTRGFGQGQVSSQTGYRVVSEPLPRAVAENLISTLAGRGIRAFVGQGGGDTVQLVLGVFTSQREADALSNRVAAAGYDVWIREATVYSIRLGPYPQTSVTAITDIAKSGAPEAAVAADPVP